MNGAAHVTLCAVVRPQASGAQPPGTSALDAVLFTTHRSAPARHGTDKGKFGIEQLLSAAVRRRLQKKMPLGVVRANLAKILSCRIDPPTSLVYGGWHGKGRKKETEPRNTRVRALNR